MAENLVVEERIFLVLALRRFLSALISDELFKLVNSHLLYFDDLLGFLVYSVVCIEFLLKLNDCFVSLI